MLCGSCIRTWHAEVYNVNYPPNPKPRSDQYVMVSLKGVGQRDMQQTESKYCQGNLIK